ncbi:cytochrome P450-dit2 [Geranomyces michiganensis]|nr:cytochrome P450-dit2 [Geranomyces michiganensis]
MTATKEYEFRSPEPPRGGPAPPAPVSVDKGRILELIVAFLGSWITLHTCQYLAARYSWIALSFAAVALSVTLKYRHELLPLLGRVIAWIALEWERPAGWHKVPFCVGLHTYYLQHIARAPEAEVVKSFQHVLNKHGIMRIFRWGKGYTPNSWGIHFTGLANARWWVKVIEATQPKLTLIGDSGRLVGHQNILHGYGEPYQRFRRVIHGVLVGRKWTTEPIIALCNDMTAELIARRHPWTKEVDFQELSSAYNADLMGRLFWGREFHVMNGDPGNLLKLWFDIDAVRGNFDIVDAAEEPIRRCRDGLFLMVTERAQEIAASEDPETEKARQDFLTAFVRALEEKTMSEKEVKDNLCVLFLAAHNTTAFALCSAVLQLSLNPDIQERARTEVFTHLADISEPTAQDMTKVPYIHNVIKEALRIDPPIPTPVVRTLNKDLHIGEYTIPHDQFLNFNFRAHHQDPAIFEDPERFDPDRWTRNKVDPYAFLAFGMPGKRQCPGASVAYLQMEVTLVQILKKFRMSLPFDSVHRKGLVNGSGTTGHAKNFNIVFRDLDKC